MLKISAVSYLKLGFSAGTVNALFNPKIGRLNANALGIRIPEAGKAVTIPYLEAMRDELAAPLGAKTALAEIERLIDLLKNGKCTASDLLEKHNSIHSRIEDELKGVHFLLVEPKYASVNDAGASLWGAEVCSKFPSLHHDIAEVGKCLAMERPTAAVFHALRSLEGAIRAMSRCLGIADPTKGAERNWGKMLSKIKLEIERRWPLSGDRMSGDGQLFEDAYAALAAIQNPWRNATMHLECTYHQAEATHIVAVVGDFMQRLSRRIDENGQPQA